MSDFKKIQKKIEVNSLNDEILQKYVNKKKGVKDIFLEILDFLQSKKTFTVNEVIKNQTSQFRKCLKNGFIQAYCNKQTAYTIQEVKTKIFNS